MIARVNEPFKENCLNFRQQFASVNLTYFVMKRYNWLFHWTFSLNVPLFLPQLGISCIPGNDFQMSSREWGSPCTVCVGGWSFSNSAVIFFRVRRKGEGRGNSAICFAHLPNVQNGCLRGHSISYNADNWREYIVVHWGCWWEKLVSALLR